MSSQPAVPMNAQRERNPHLVALAALAATLADPTPCASEDSRLWISEDRDQREWAAGLCVGCPLLAACRAAGRAEVFGIWGGRDRSPVRPAEPAGPEFESGWMAASRLVSVHRGAAGHKSGHNAGLCRYRSAVHPRRVSESAILARIDSCSDAVRRFDTRTTHVPNTWCEPEAKTVPSNPARYFSRASARSTVG